MEEIVYLSKFWEHSKGDTVIINGDTLTIIKVYEDFPEQVLLSNNEVFFIQDVLWSPSLEECVASVCKHLKIKVSKNELVYNKFIKPYPSNLNEFYQQVTEFRSFILNNF